MSEMLTYGQIAYEAYCAASDGKSLVSGEPLPSWDDLDERTTDAWMAAGKAVSDQVIEDGAACDGNHVTALPAGTVPAVAHTYTAGCDGHHPIGEPCPDTTTGGQS